MGRVNTFKKYINFLKSKIFGLKLQNSPLLSPEDLDRPISDDGKIPSVPNPSKTQIIKQRGPFLSSTSFFVFFIYPRERKKTLERESNVGRGAPVRVEGGCGCVEDLPAAGRYHPQEWLHRNQEQAMQGTDPSINPLVDFIDFDFDSIRSVLFWCCCHFN